MRIFLLLLILSVGVHARTLSPVAGTDSGHDQRPEYLAILAKVKSFGTFTQKEAPAKVEVKPREKSRGELAVEEAKARNRALIKSRTEEEKKLAEKTEFSKDAFDNDLAKLRAEDKRIRDGWKKEVRDQLAVWQTQQKIFLGKLKVYKEATFPIPVKEEKIVEKPVLLRDIPEVHIVHSAFKVPVKDQEGRATCAAFTGVRAMEILLAQNGETQDLSEQYFYWASKPDCQKSPCSKKGSWVTRGFDHSSQMPQVDIPLETNCQYGVTNDPKNDTQLPLSSGCKSGAVKISRYERIQSLAEVIDRLKKNMPVIMSSKLTPNFYLNEGFISLEDSQKNGATDSHAMGHAYLAVGVMELPEKLHEKEGKYCLVVNNSWGEGWGAGGHACITENWLLKYRLPSSFVAVNAVSL